MPSNRSPNVVNPGPGKLSAGQVPASALSFPSSGSGDLEAHIHDPVDAHMAFAIGIPELNPITGQPLLSSAGGPYDGESVGDALTSLADLLPTRPNKIGFDNISVPNSGFTNWSAAMTMGGSAIHGGFKSGSAAVVTKYLTPAGSTGVQVINGVVYPADRGVLAIYHTTNGNFFNPLETTLVGALWLGTSVITPPGIPGANFNETTRPTGQVDYTPTGTGLDIITLTARLPYLNSYPGSQYSPYLMNFTSYQLGKYQFPVTLINGNSGSFLLVHWKETYATTLTSIQPASLTLSNLSVGNCYSAVPSDPVDYDNVVRANVFVDTLSGSGPTGATISTSPTGTLTTSKLSGLDYYTNTGFQVNVVSTASNVFSNAFLTNVVASVSVPTGYESALPVAQTIMSGFNGATVSYPLFDGSNIVDNGTSTPYTLSSPPNTTSVAKFTNATLSTVTVASPLPKPVFPNAQAIVRWRGAFSSPVDATSTEQYLVDPAYSEPTLTTDDLDNFVSEAYRYVTSYSPTDPTVTIHPAGGNVFNSAIVVGASDLQVYSGRLVYPSTDFSAAAIRPIQTLGAGSNYASVHSADATNTKRRWVRAFDTGIARNTGKIQLVGLASASFAASNTIDPTEVTDHPNGAIVQIKIPGLTGWLDLGRSDGTPDNDKTQDFRGCKVGVVESGGVTTVTFSTGGSTTSPNSEGKYLLFVRVAFIKNGVGDGLSVQSIQWLPPT